MCNRVKYKNMIYVKQNKTVFLEHLLGFEVGVFYEFRVGNFNKSYCFQYNT